AKMAAGSVSRIHSDSSRNRSLRSEPTATLAASRTASDAGGERDQDRVAQRRSQASARHDKTKSEGNTGSLSETNHVETSDEPDLQSAENRESSGFDVAPIASAIVQETPSSTDSTESGSQPSLQATGASTEDNGQRHRHEGERPVAGQSSSEQGIASGQESAAQNVSQRAETASEVSSEESEQTSGLVSKRASHEREDRQRSLQEAKPREPNSSRAEIAARAAEGAIIDETVQRTVVATRVSQLSNAVASSVASTVALQDASPNRGNAGVPGGQRDSVPSSAFGVTIRTESHDPASTAKPARAADTVSRVKLIQRVSKAFQHLGPSGGVVRLRLAPAELGSIQIEMRIQHRKVQARVVAETDAAAAALREHLPELRARLESYGMQIERLDVETGGEEGQRGTAFDEGSQHQTREQPRHPPHSDTGTVPQSQEPHQVSQDVSSADNLAHGMDVRL
ncbi:MAG: flagellar hook-length control protein FliK, partial [Rubripirellula sp.]